MRATHLWKWLSSQPTRSLSCLSVCLSVCLCKESPAALQLYTHAINQPAGLLLIYSTSIHLSLLVTLAIVVHVGILALSVGISLPPPPSPSGCSWWSMSMTELMVYSSNDIRPSTRPW